MQALILADNQIGDIGVTALAKAVTPVSEGGSGGLTQLTVSWRPTALFPSFELWHAHSPDSDVLFDVRFAGA